MQRRLSMAATLVHDPTLIFLDEPTAGIDPVLRSKFWDRFRELRDEGRTLFVTTQYVSEAAYCDLVAVMGDGELLMVDTPDGLRYRAYGGDVVEMRTAKFLDYPTEMELQKQPYITGKIEHTGDLTTRMVVKEASTAMPALIEWFRNRGIEVISIEEFLPPFDEVFVELVKEEDEKSG
jgi:ABC-2 type transport system ATP-binding protein